MSPIKVECKFCKVWMDPESSFAWHRVVGWERRGSMRPGGSRGGSDITLREPIAEFACDTCIQRLKKGLSAGQGSLL